MTMTQEPQHPLVQEFIALGEKYKEEMSRLIRENKELREELLDVMAFHGTRDEEKFPSDLVRRLIIAEESPLKIFREYRELSQITLQKKSGISQSIISGIESGKRRGTIDVFKALAESLDVDIDDLI